jgi:UV-stimulated scaffold protein A
MNKKDRVKCPIHGRVVARDENGNIVNECDRNDPSFKNQINCDNEASIMPWQDEELIADINANTGKDIQAVSAEKAKRGKKRKISSNLTDLTKEDSPKKRLEKKFFTAKSLSKVGSILDSIERRQNQSRFYQNFNYSIQS